LLLITAVTCVLPWACALIVRLAESPLFIEPFARAWKNDRATPRSGWAADEKSGSVPKNWYQYASSGEAARAGNGVVLRSKIKRDRRREARIIT